MTKQELANKIFESKKDFHNSMAKLPIEEKVKILIEMQKRVAEIEKNKENPNPMYLIVWGM